MVIGNAAGLLTTFRSFPLHRTKKESFASVKVGERGGIYGQWPNKRGRRKNAYQSFNNGGCQQS